MDKLGKLERKLTAKPGRDFSLKQMDQILDLTLKDPSLSTNLKDIMREIEREFPSKSAPKRKRHSA